MAALLLLLAAALTSASDVAGDATEVAQLRREIARLQAEVARLEGGSTGATERPAGDGQAPSMAVQFVHKHTYATSDPLAAAQFVVDNLNASGPGLNHHKCGATNTVTFPGTGTPLSNGNDFLMHFVYNPRKAPGPVYMNATDLGLYEEHLRARSFRNNTFDQFIDNHIGLVVDDLDPFVRTWRAAGVPYVCRTWCCAAGMPQYPDRCPQYSLNRTGGCEVGCYVEVPHGIISTCAAQRRPYRLHDMYVCRTDNLLLPRRTAPPSHPSAPSLHLRTHSGAAVRARQLRRGSVLPDRSPARRL